MKITKTVGKDKTEKSQQMVIIARGRKRTILHSDRFDTNKVFLNHSYHFFHLKGEMFSSLLSNLSDLMA